MELTNSKLDITAVFGYLSINYLNFNVIILIFRLTKNK